MKKEQTDIDQMSTNSFVYFNDMNLLREHHPANHACMYKETIAIWIIYICHQHILLFPSSAPSGFPIDVVQNGNHCNDEGLVIAWLHHHKVELLACHHLLLPYL